MKLALALNNYILIQNEKKNNGTFDESIQLPYNILVYAYR